MAAPKRWKMAGPNEAQLTIHGKESFKEIKVGYEVLS